MAERRGIEALGLHLIDGRGERGHGVAFRAFDAARGGEFGPEFHEAGDELVDRAAALAGAAASAFAAVEPERRAALLETIAAGLVELGDGLLDTAARETALPRERLVGERARTVLQLQQFAALLREGSWVEAHLTHGDPQRTPLPRPDLRRMLVPLGAVAVFGASNFPFAYSVAGGDTAAALAAGCPVVVKGHPAHPGTSELVGLVVQRAVAALGLPCGCFALVHGRTPATGERLVDHAAIKAVGFTGSLAGGRALFDRAARRSEPIPVFAEMGSMHPVVVLPRALAARPQAIAERIAASALLAQGQFCTSPGLVAFVDGAGADAFTATLRQRLSEATGGPTVHPTIRSGYERSLADVLPLVDGVVHARGGDATATAVCPALLEARAATVLRHPRLRSEIYGPAVVATPCANDGELLLVVEALHGHLTATVHGEPEDFVAHAAVLTALRSRVGRLIANGVPTGVEVDAAMVHGGPYPASTDARFSAVGTTSIRRWVRPACWQDWPHDLLPPELRDDNPRRIRRVVNGVVEG